MQSGTIQCPFLQRRLKIGKQADGHAFAARARSEFGFFVRFRIRTADHDAYDGFARLGSKGINIDQTPDFFASKFCRLGDNDTTRRRTSQGYILQILIEKLCSFCFSSSEHTKDFWNLGNLEIY